MKRIYTLMLMFAALTLAQAQQVKLSVGAENKKINVAEVDEMFVVGEMGDLTIAVTHGYSSVLGSFTRKNCVIMALDKDMNTVRMLELDDTKDCSVRAASLYEGHVYVLIENSKRKSSKFERVEVDAATMNPVGQKTTIFEYNSERKDENYSWVAQSPDGALTGFVYITTNRKSDKLEATEMLLDEQMNVEWRRDYPIYSLSNLWVTNDGELITIGTGSTKADPSSRIFVSVVNEANSFDMNTKVPVAIDEICIAACKGDKVLALAFGAGVDDKEIHYMGISADMKKQEIKVDDRTLSKDELCVLDNVDLGKKASRQHVDYILLKHCKETEYGAVGTLQHRWTIVSCDSRGSCNVTSWLNGIVVFGIDIDGNVIWHNSIRANMKQSGYPKLLKNALCVDGGDVYFLQSENPKWPATYDIEKKIKSQKTNGGTKAVGVYHITANGAITKQMIPMVEKSMLSQTTAKVENGFVGFMALGRGAQMVKIELK